MGKPKSLNKAGESFAPGFLKEKFKIMKNECISDWTGKRIKYFMAQNDIRTKELVPRVHVKFKTLASYLEGRAEPPLVVLKRICREFSITIDQFLEGSPDSLLSN